MIILIVASPAVAQQSRTEIDCYCTDSTGLRVEMGQTACLHVDGRSFTATCQMSLNVPIWREVADGCAISRLEPPVPRFPRREVTPPL